MAESAAERRRREIAQRVMARALPDMSQLLKNMVGSRDQLTTLAEVYTPQYEKMVRALVPDVASAASSAVSSAAASSVATALTGAHRSWVPALKLDYTGLFPNLAALNKRTLRSLLPGIQAIQVLQRDQFAELIARVRATALRALPPNWQDDDIAIPENLEELVLDEGLALAWVPPTPVVAKLFAAQNAAERRTILGRRWRSVTQACVVELETVRHPSLNEHVSFALDSSDALLDDKHRAAQALSANLLDTMLRTHFDKTSRGTMTGRSRRPDIEDYSIRVAVVLGGIWGSHGQFWAERGDPIPRAYSRHGSAHGVSRRQYSRINSLLALMHVTSLLKLLDDDLAEYLTDDRPQRSTTGKQDGEANGGVS